MSLLILYEYLFCRICLERVERACFPICEKCYQAFLKAIDDTKAIKEREVKP